MAKGNQFFKKFFRSPCAGGHVGIIDPHHFHVGKLGLLQCCQIRLPLVILLQTKITHLCSQQAGHSSISRITRVGNQHLIARVQKSHGNVHNTLFGTHEWQNFIFGIQPNVKKFAVPPGISLTQSRNSRIALIRMVFRFTTFASYCFDNSFIGSHIRTANTKVNDIHTLFTQGGNFFQLTREIVFTHHV